MVTTNTSYLEYCDENWLGTTKLKLEESLEILESHKPTLSKINYQTTCKQYGRTFRISNAGELSAKIYHCATWGDKHNLIYGIINSLDSRQATDFPKALKSLSSNIVIADVTNGPVSGIIINNEKKFENNWYNILYKSIKLSLRANSHFMKAIERKKLEFIKKQQEDAKIMQEQEKLRLIREEKEKKKADEERITKALDALSNLDSWEDFDA